MNFLYWAQKAKQVHNAAMRAASEQDADYMDATPLSQFVVWKAAAVSNAVRDLLSDASVSDEEVWAPLWRLLPGTEHQHAMYLILDMVLRAFASWQFRVMRHVSGFPLCFLVVLETLPAEADTRRAAVAKLLMETDNCCLGSSPYGDMPVKVKQLFLDEWHTMAESGKCPMRLYAFLLAWRSRAPIDTQHVEGFMSVLQNITNRAHAMDKVLANARMSLKLGYPISAQTCCTLDGVVEQRIASGLDQDRFAGAVVAADLRRTPEFKVCEHHRGPAETLVAPWALQVKRLAEVGSRFVSMLSVGGHNHAFVIGWAYHSCLWVAPGHLTSDVGLTCFAFKVPMVMLPLVDYFVEIGLGNIDMVANSNVSNRMWQPKETTRVLRQAPIVWSTRPTRSLLSGFLDHTASTEKQMQWTRPKAATHGPTPKRRKGTGA